MPISFRRRARFFLTACSGLLALNSPVRGQAQTHYRLSPHLLVASYTIEVELDPLTRTVTGSELIRCEMSPVTLQIIFSCTFT